MISKSGSVPLYKQLKNEILQQIRSGALGLDSRVASERELSRQYDISRMTARKAIEELARERYLIRIIGKGTYVTSAQRTSEFIQIVSFTEDMKRQGYKVASKVLGFEIKEPTEELKKKLKLRGNGKVVYLERIRYANGVPTAIQASYLSHALCPGLISHDFSRDSLYRVLSEDLGLRLSFSSNTLESRISSREEMRKLKLTHPIGVFVLDQTTFLEQGDPIESVMSVFRGDRYKFHNIATWK
jgi:GntR family transcriptional regulator